MFSAPTLISSLAYFYMIYTKNIYWKYILKPATTILIIGVAAESEVVASKYKLLGLVFSLIGDIFLMFAGDLTFTLGLASFLTAHIFYIYVFYSSRTSNQNLSILALLLLTASSYFSYLYKGIYSQGGYVMVASVMVYVSAISIMVYYALLNNNPYLAIGAISFMVSDSALAFDKFIINEAESKFEYLVMITYWLAQYLIAKF